ncbi:MAG: metallophosphoesterase [Chloroflexi bacterium]|nr:metallophosphoesterase [Chloroflexota bacterium]
MSRIIDLDQGRLMVVTDLHGDYPVYCRYRDHFLALREAGQADILILDGDFIHNDGPAPADGSLKIVLDLIQLQHDLGPALIVLLGNHEMPHIYGVTLGRGNAIYTPRFEMALGDRRPEIIAFFDSLPFYVRTRAGVTVTHAGASMAAITPEGVQRLAAYSHAAELAKVDAILDEQDRDSLRAGVAKMNGQPYEEMVIENLGFAALTENRYDDLLRGIFMTAASDEYDQLWDALFNKNEYEYQESYGPILRSSLMSLSQDYARQNFLISGHINVFGGGHTVVDGRQLRLASWTHARPREAGQYLLFDAGKPVGNMGELLKGLGTVFR